MATNISKQSKYISWAWKRHASQEGDVYAENLEYVARACEQLSQKSCPRRMLDFRKLSNSSSGTTLREGICCKRSVYLDAAASISSKAMVHVLMNSSVEYHCPLDADANAIALHPICNEAAAELLIVAKLAVAHGGRGPLVQELHRCNGSLNCLRRPQ